MTASVLLLTAAVLAGCATGADSAGGASGSASATAVVDGAEFEGAWLDGGRMIGLVTWGSSSCVPSADGVSADGQTVTVELLDPEDAACTADYAPRVTLVPLPEGVDPSADVELVTTGAVEARGDLDGVPGLTVDSAATDYQPSAGWADDDLLVLLTWGSSSCAPAIQSATVSAPAEITVAFAEAAPDQVCTMDMAPRTALAQLEEQADDDVDWTVLLVGAEFDSVAVPVLGQP
ncbi:hypothetical protein GCM10025738_17440 [Microbacterium fluvii]